MPKLTVLVGLPASGKSTLARKIVAKDPDHTIRVNNDDIRKMFWGHPHTSYNEGLVKRILMSVLTESSISKFNIVIDNLNLGQNTKVYGAWASINNYEFEVILVDTPIEECIRRDLLREVTVGEKVIRQFVKGFEYAKAAQVKK
jgi:predicted kinase